jgi:transcriptional regulator with XRE-family HTH domain
MDSGTQAVLTPEKQLISELQDVEYRRAFVEGHATDTVAFQLRAMRKTEVWEQKDVAERLGNRKLQPMISRYENPDYGKYSISTLLELAAVFDVALAVRFVPFSELVEWDLSTNKAKVCPAPFAKDEELYRIANRATEQKGVFGSFNIRVFDQTASGHSAASGDVHANSLGSMFAEPHKSSAERPEIAA